MTNSCPLLIRCLTQAPLRLADSYHDAFAIIHVTYECRKAGHADRTSLCLSSKTTHRI
jgi:hypothetical protein